MVGKRRIARAIATVVVGSLAAFGSLAPAGAAEPAPTAVPDLFVTTNGHYSTLGLLPGVLDNDVPGVPGDPLTAQLVEGPANGTLTLFADGGMTYAADAFFEGDDTFTYVAVGPTGVASAPATVTMRTDIPDPDPRQPTRVIMGPLSLTVQGVNVSARVERLDGLRIPAEITFTRGAKTLCTGSNWVPGGFFITTVWATCTVPVGDALPILLGGEVTATYGGDAFSHQPSTVTGSPLLEVLHPDP